MTQSDAAVTQFDAAGFGADPASRDPGRPPNMFGPKADARLYVGDQEVGYVFFTALTPNELQRAHMFAVPEPRASVNVSDYYLSLVLDDETWRIASYDAAQGGRVRFTLGDGRTYAGNAADLNLKLTTTQATLVNDDTNFYLRGEMTVTVPSTQSGGAPLRIESRINSAL